MRALPTGWARLPKQLLPRLDFLFNAPRRQLMRAASVAGAIGLLGLMFNTHFGLYLDLAETRCLPARVYLGYPRTEFLERGDIVSFRADSQIMFGLMTGNRMAKVIAGVSGDHVLSDATGAFVNGVRVGDRNPLSLKNLTAKGKAPIDMDRDLADGEIFVVGTLPRSFDSRYWGVMPALSVDRLMVALF